MSNNADYIKEFNWLKEHPEFEQRPASIREFIGPNYLNIAENVRPALLEIMVDLFGEETNPERICLYEEGIFTGGIGVGKGHVLQENRSITSKLQGMDKLIDIQDVKVGDELVGSDGKPTKVTGVYDRGRLPVYRVTFTDGASLLVDGEHLWAVERQSRGLIEGSSKLQRIWKPEVAATADLASRKLKYGDSFVYRIPLVKPVQWPEREFVIDPYLLGLYLGDGDAKGSLRIGCKTKLWLEKNLEALAHPGGVVMVRSGHHLCFTNHPTSSPNPYLGELERLQLRGVTSRFKFVPDEYLRSSPDQRLALLRGLMDSDGSAFGRNHSVFSSYSADLAEGVRQLALSLGGMATTTSHKRTSEYGAPDPIEYHVSVNLDQVCPFGPGPKRDRWKPRTNQHPKRAIVSIEPEGEERVVCISVDAPDKLYCAGEDWIVTHNTTLASVIIPYMAHWTLCLRDPQGYYNLMPGSRIAFMQMSTSGPQAKEVVFGDIKARIDNSPWFRQNYPYDHKFTSQFRFPKDVWIIPGDSAETTFEGYNILGGILDEADSHKVTKNKDYADQGFTTISGRITSRFEDKGFLLVVGQMKKASGFASKKYREMLQNPRAYTSLLTIWESVGWTKHIRADGTRDSFWYDTKRYMFTTKDLAELQGFPEHILEVPKVYERQFLNSPQKALRDLAGRPPAVNSPLFHDPTTIDVTRDLYKERYGDFIPIDQQNRFHADLRARNSAPRVGHIDVATSPDGDGLGLAIAHVSELVEIDGERKPFIVFDLVMQIRAPAGREIFLGDIRKLIYDLRDERKFKIVKITSDGYQSTDMRQQLMRRRIQTELLSADRTTLPYFDLHDAISERRVAIPPYMVSTSFADPTPKDIVYAELSHLQDEGSKIDHPPDGSKDVADAIACTVSSIMNDRQFHRRMSGSNPFTDGQGGSDAMNGSPIRGNHPAMTGAMPKAPIPPRVQDEPIQWRPPTR